ncbi:MAG: ATP-binding cassette subfamily B protein [Oleiphilaceae bacterium]|jgi:ATP-binding cassette subfamily B protein
MTNQNNIFPNVKFTNHIKHKLNLIHPYVSLLLLALMITGITIAIQLSFPKALSFFIDNIDQPNSKEWLLSGAIIAISVAMLYCIANGIRFYLFESVGEKIVNHLKNTLFSAIMRLDIAFFDGNETGELVSRLSSDVESLKDTLSIDFAMLLKSCIVAFGSLILLLFISIELTAMLLLIIPFTLTLSHWLGGKARHLSFHQQEYAARSIQVAQESISNIRVIHAFNAQKKTIQQFAGLTGQELGSKLTSARLFGVFQALSSMIFYLSTITLLWFTSNRTGPDGLSTGDLTSFLLYAAMLSSSVGAISGFWGEWMRALGSTSRLFDIIEQSSLNQEQENAMTKPALTGQIEFKQITFTYPQRPEINALTKVNFKIGAGEKIALVGHSGSGKSTIANLLLAFYKPTEGDILFDGYSSEELGRHYVRNSIVMVEQEPSLFSGTIADNILYSLNKAEATKEACIQAAKQANAHEFITQFPDKYDTKVGDQGVQLSGGQKQRIAIARAMVRNPKILILDEATSALDTESEHLVQDALNQLMKDRTTIIIAHRLSTVSSADKVIVLSHGRIVELDTHTNLMNNAQSTYYKMVDKQSLTIECL